MTVAALVTPRSVHNIPLDGDVRARWSTARQALHHVVRADDLDEVTSLVTTVGDELRERGVRFLGTFPVSTSGAQASIAVAIRELIPPHVADEAFGEHATEALLHETSTTRPFADCRLVTMPAGPTIASVVAGQFDLPPDETGTDEMVTIPTFRVEFLVPTPEWDGIVVLDVSTTDEDSWPEVSREAVRLARSLRFLDDGEPLREGEHLLRL